MSFSFQAILLYYAQMIQQKIVNDHFSSKSNLFEEDNDFQQAFDDMGPWNISKNTIINHQITPISSIKRQWGYLMPKSTINPKQNNKSIPFKQKLGSKSLQLGKCQIYEPEKRQSSINFYSPKKKRDHNLPNITNRQQAQNSSFSWAKVTEKIGENENIQRNYINQYGEKKLQLSKSKIKLANICKSPQNKLMTTIDSLIKKERAQFNIYKKCVIPIQKHSIKERKIEKIHYYFQ